LSGGVAGDVLRGDEGQESVVVNGCLGHAAGVVEQWRGDVGLRQGVAPVDVDPDQRGVAVGAADLRFACPARGRDGFGLVFQVFGGQAGTHPQPYGFAGLGGEAADDEWQVP
jgi:hypothetical protein